MPASRLLSLGGLLATFTTSLAAGPAGNENYASQSRALRAASVRSILPRSNSLNFQTTAVTFVVGEQDDAKHYISPVGENYKSHTLASDWGLDGLKGAMMPVTVFNVEGEVTCSTLGDKIAAFEAADDVWDDSFMQAIVLQTTSSFHVTSELAGCAKNWGGDLIIKSGNATSDVNDIGLAHVQGSLIPQGPYIAKIGDDITLTEIYRVYRDQAMAMTTAVIPTIHNTFTELSVPTDGLNTLSIPVPSRLYTLDVVNPRPLEGRRVAVKDIYDMAGLKTGCGNRAYFDFYPAREVTAPSIQRLVDQGAIIVARSKTSSFANGEGAAGDWVEQISPFNPRGDGYQQPSSSSSGPGAAMGAYDWLDNAIGSDTGCSILCPSGAQGLFGMRPTHGAITLEGVMPLQPALDTAGFFSRDAIKGRDFSKGWYGDRFENYTSFPTTVILPNASWTFADDSAAAPVYARFRSAFLDFLQPTSVDESPSFEPLWNSTGNFASAGNRSLSALVGPIYTYLINHYQWFNFAAPWFEEYGAVNDGRLPQIPPVPTSRWGNGRVNVTDEIYAQALADKQTYMEFISDNVLVADPETCSSTIYAYPYATGESPSYRDTYSGGPVVRNGGLGANTISPFMAENPSLIVPIGQVPYQSRITNHTEYLPAVVVLMAAKECDYMLWDLAAAMQEAGVISPVQAGKLAYPL